MNHCGECTACCNSMGVVEIAKAPGEWCTHCNRGVGCRIYADRPQSGAEFRCVWLSDGLPAVAKIHPHYPAAHRVSGMAAYLKSVVERGKVVFVTVNEETDGSVLFGFGYCWH